MPLQIGTLLAHRYLIQAVVGTGGTAIVYRALDKQNNKTVAVKVLRPEYVADENFLERFDTEAQIAAAVYHQNFIAMYEVGSEADIHFIVMEYFDGETLDKMLEHSGRLSEKLAISMTLSMLAAANHAHTNKIVHRDIKPQNVLVKQGAPLKIADFGIARRYANPKEIEAHAVGSVHYLSPEQAMGEVGDSRSDIYSIGVVLYEMLTGKVPFEGETVTEVLRKHVELPPPSVRAVDSGLSRAVDQIIRRALCKDVDRRYQTAKEMAEDLQMALQRPKGGFVKYPPSSKERLKREKAAEISRKRAKVFKIALIALAVLAVTGAGLFYKWRVRDTFIMPNLVGQALRQAQEALSAYNVQTEVDYCYSEVYAQGRVLSQASAPGTRLSRDSKVGLTVSKGSAYYELEPLVGFTEAEAITYLRGTGVEQISYQYIQNELYMEGLVIGTNLDPGTQRKDTPLILTVSGKAITMPSLIGMPLEGAKAVLSALGLKLGSVEESYSADAKSGTVFEQSVEAGSRALTGEAVNLTLALPHATVYYPDAPLTVVVPLDNTKVSVVFENGGMLFEAKLDAGTQRIELCNDEPGTFALEIYMDGVYIETVRVSFS